MGRRWGGRGSDLEGHSGGIAFRRETGAPSDFAAIFVVGKRVRDGKMMEGGEGGRPACRSVDYECVWERGRGKEAGRRARVGEREGQRGGSYCRSSIIGDHIGK